MDFGDVLLQQIINGVSLGAMYALLALGFTMVYGIIELINFAHFNVFMVGSFVGLWAFQAMGFSGQSEVLYGLPLIGVLPRLEVLSHHVCPIVIALEGEDLRWISSRAVSHLLHPFAFFSDRGLAMGDLSQRAPRRALDRTPWSRLIRRRGCARDRVLPSRSGRTLPASPVRRTA